MNNIEKIKTYAIVTNQLDKFVILKKDNKGYYIEYAFIEGAPHDNRCLDWYHSFQLEAYERNGWFDDLSQEEKDKRIKSIQADRDSKIGKIFRLYNYTCGWENITKENLEVKKREQKMYHPDKTFDIDYLRCTVGSPSKKCVHDWAKNWTYEQPCKCACWALSEEEDYYYDRCSISTERLLEVCKKHNISINEFKNE